MQLANKTVVLTGISRGIGLALAHELAIQKCHIIGVSRSNPKGLADDLKVKGAASVELLSLDLAQEASVEALLQQLQSRQVDVLINNAGLLTGGLLEDQSWVEISDLIQVNIKTLIRLSQGLLPGMLKRGSGKIVNNASVAGVMHFPCSSVYSASKAAVIAFTNSLENELKGSGVSTLLLITPGVETTMFRDIENRYGDHLNLRSLTSMPADIYARKVVRAIMDDDGVFEPTGAQGIGLFLARHVPRIFSSLVATQFSRKKRR